MGSTSLAQKHRGVSKFRLQVIIIAVEEAVEAAVQLIAEVVTWFLVIVIDSGLLPVSYAYQIFALSLSLFLYIYIYI